MECLYQSYLQHFGHHSLPIDTNYYSVRPDLDIQQTVNPGRWHPYVRSHPPMMSRHYDPYGQYPQYYDYSNVQFPVCSDGRADDSESLTGNWYPSNTYYAYSNLDYLQDKTSKTGEEPGSSCHKILPTQAFDINTCSHNLHNVLGENYDQLQTFNPSRKSASTTIGQTRARDKYRIVYTETQKLLLEVEYKKTIFITEKRRAEFAEEIDLSERQIKFWFQNRRVKDRRGKSAKTRKQIQENKIPTTPPNNTVRQIQAGDKATILPPCRFAETRTSLEEFETDATPSFKGVNVPQTANSTVRATYRCSLPAPRIRYPVSPSEWGTLSEATLLTALNVSPILTCVENDLNPRS